MPAIRPSSDIRNHYNEISDFCHRNREPVYLTRNGAGDLAVMSIETYEELLGRYELYSMLERSLADAANGRTEQVDSVFDQIERELADEI